MFRGRENMSNIIIPSNSQLVMIGASSLSLGDAVSITVPPQVKLVLNCAFGNQDDD
jgi:hypothetical protein